MTRICVIGPGRAGTAVALVAVDAGHVVTAVAGRSPDSVQRFVGLVPSAAPGSVDDVVPGAEVVVLAVPDDELAALARTIAASDVVIEGQRWVHLSGRHGPGVLGPLALAGARTAACHPAQTLADPQTARATLPGSMWAVTAAAPDRGWAHQLVTSLHGSPVDVADVDRTAYHLAATLAANGTSAVVSLARDLLIAIGVPEPARLLEPLARAAVDGAAGRGPAALTGPVRRGDAETVAAHLAELEVIWPSARPVYAALARLALEQSGRAGLDAAAAARVIDVLGDGPP